MTPKEYASQLIYNHYSISGQHRFSAAHAVKTVKHILKALTDYGKNSHELQNMDSEIRFYNEVINEINNY
jgi:hypothetical protein